MGNDVEGAWTSVQNMDSQALAAASETLVAGMGTPRDVLTEAGIEIPSDAVVSVEVSLEEDTDGPTVESAVGRKPIKRCTTWCVEIPKRGRICRKVCEWY